MADTFPAALTAVTWTCSGTNGGTCTASGSGSLNDLATLPINGSVTYSVSATVDLGPRGTVVNTATVTPPTGVTDPITSNNTATDTDAIVTGGTSCGTDPNLVGCWQMEEGSGSVLVDGSSFTNDANLFGSPAWAAGRVGTYSLDLNGSSQYAEAPDDASLDITNQITLAAWIKPETFSANPQGLINKAINGTGAAGTDGFELTLSSTGSTWPQKVFFRINQATSGDTYRVNSTTSYPIDGNTWMHVAATFDGTDLKLYINGQLEGTVSGVGQTIAVNSLPLTLGAQDGATPDRFYMGWMDDARVYNRALSASEIQQLAGAVTTYSLTVTKIGTGSGTVTSVPAGIDCGATCSSSFNENTLVTLTAAAAANSTFTGWSGAGCSGTGTCAVTMDAVKTVTATFTQNAACYTLTTTVSPAGSGTIDNTTAQNCTGGYTPGTTVELSAVPNTGYLFSSWSGGASGNTNPLSLTMDGNKSITAEFAVGPGAALDFGGTNAYVNFGNPAKLHLAQFTLETWFRRDGAGDTTQTGTDGSYATTLVARGRGEIEDPTVDLNYFLGIDGATNKLVADFEEGAGGTSPSLNHPVYGATTITNGVWHHVAATYDGTTWKLYLDGVLDGELAVGQPPAAAGNQYASLGAALTSTGAPDGFFDGVIDEARIWNRALSQAEIQAGINQELTTGSGLVARWGLNEGIGVAIHDSLASPAEGNILGTSYTWADGAPFNIPVPVTISGNAGVAGAVLSYTDGTQKTVTADGSGLYSLQVPYNWSGTVTPSKAGYTFLPAVKMFTNVTTNMVGQDFTASQDTYALTVNIVGSGTVTPDITPPYHLNDVVTLTAVPDNGWTFSGWTGCTGSGDTCSVTMDGDKTITAMFTENAVVLGEPSGSLVSWDESFAWTGTSKATWYELEVQTAGGTQMFDLWYTNTSAGCESDTSCVVLPAEAVNIVNGEYQWRVRDYGSYGYGSWTGWQSFTPPANAVLGDPVGALTSWDRSFEWTGVSAATYYYMQVQTASGGAVFDAWYTSGEAGCEGGTSCGVTPNQALHMNSGEYRWRLLDYGGYGYGRWTAWQSFSLDVPVASVSLGGPAGSLTSWDHSFGWTGFPDGTWYYLMVQTASGTPVFDAWYTSGEAGCDADTSCGISPVQALHLANGSYQWRILDYGTYGYGNWTAWQGFTLDIPPVGGILGEPVGEKTSWDHTLRVDGLPGFDLVLPAGAGAGWDAGVRCLVPEWAGGL